MNGPPRWYREGRLGKTVSIVDGVRERKESWRKKLELTDIVGGAGVASTLETEGEPTEELEISNPEFDTLMPINTFYRNQ
jgi:hypothetical protein